MKNIWKKIIATCCVAVMLMTLPGVNVLADELQDEDVIISVAEDPKALPEDTCHSSEDEISIAEDPETSLEDTYQSNEDEISFAEDILEENISEELVGVGSYGVNLNSEYYKQPRNPFSKPQCTWYAFGRALEKTGVEVPYRSNAVNWMSGAVTTPMANSIAVWKPYGNLVSSAGHVAFVEKIENGKLYISEGNRINAPEYSEGTVRLSDGYYTQTYPDTTVKYSYIVPNGYIPLSGGSTTTPTVSFTPWSNDNYTYIRETDASIGMEINASGGTITSEGMYLYDSNESYLAQGSNASHTLSRVYFQINAEMGYTLRGGTTYKYKFYAIVNGQTYWSDMYSFTTTPPAVTNINNCTVSLSTTSYTYNGSARTPSVTVKNGSTTLTSGTDYTVSYSNNVNAGAATVTITGKGYYTGTVYRSFTINKAAATLSFASGSINKTDLNTTFTNTLTKTTDGTVTFKSSNTAVATVNSSSGLVTTRGVGTATITATSTEGNNYKAASASYTLTVGIVVGNNVFATFGETTGAVEFYSNNGELWRDWVEKIGVEKTKITSLKIASGKVYLPKDSSNIFAIGEDAPFRHDSNLKELDLSGFDTSRVTNMSEMFLGCGILTELNLSNFNTSKVTNMSGMFKDCRELTNLDLSSFDTSNVTDMSYMFSANMIFQVYHLKHVNLKSFNTSKVKNMSNMFFGCYEMPSLDLSNFDTSNVTDMSYMFNWCQNLTSLNIENFVTSNVSNMASMFAECYNLTELDVSGFDTSNVTNMLCMFSSCQSLTKLDVSSFDTSNVTDMGAMFSQCQGLTKLDVSSFDTSNVTRMHGMFSSCANLTNLDLSSFDTSKVNIMRFMFLGCTNLKSLNLSNFNISNVEDMGEMFEACSSLESLDLSSFDTSNIKVNFDMFLGCAKLELLKTPKKQTIADIALPYNMYDSAGNVYTELPLLSKSIVLTKSKSTSLQNCSITLSSTSYTFDGKEKKPAVTVKNGTTTLTNNTDYTVAYSNNTNAGTAKVTVTGKGNYAGTITKKFTIVKATPSLKFASSSLSKKTGDAAFTNALTKTTDGAVTFKSSNTSVATVNSTSGKVTIKSAGTAVITATAEEGTNYKSGNVSYTLTVTTPSPAGFSDVQDPSHPYYKAIYWAAEAGITKGYSDGTFGIDRACTRSEAVMFLWRMAGKPAPVDALSSPFKDVPKSHAHYKAILWAAQKGITKGYSDGTFGINKTCTRGQIMTFIWRFKGQPAPKAAAKSPFSDVPKNHAYYKAILWGSQNKITNGFSDGTFGINKNCTRGQIVTFLYRAK